MKEVYMKRAIELAKKARGKVNPNPMVGCVIVKDGLIIGEGYHKYYGADHGEIDAFKNLREDCRGADLYVNLEPCSHYGKTPPCVEEIVRRKISRVYVSMLDPNPRVAGSGIEYLKHHGVEVKVGILEDESRKLNEIFIHYIEEKTPYILMKYAMTLDGYIAREDYESKWITGYKARSLVHRLRSEYMGIMLGINSILKDDPRLTARIEGGRNPYKIILDSQLRIDLDSNILKFQAEKVIIFTSESRDMDKERQLKELGAKVYIIQSKNRKLNISQTMEILGDLGIDSVLVEGGSQVNYSVLEEGLVDKVMIFIAGKLIGGKNSISPVGGSGVDRLEDAFRLDFQTIGRVGGDIYIEGYMRR